MDAPVSALVVTGTELYAGGSFLAAGGVGVSRIAKWDGSAWTALGQGVAGRSVNAIARSGADIYVGGLFTAIGGVTANRIAKWNGTAWSALGTGLNGEVLALAVSGSDLYVGGSFSTAGGVTANNIAKWNGTAWAALGANGSSGLSGSVSALAVRGGDLYAAGQFAKEAVIGSGGGGVFLNSIAKWDGTSWSPLGGGLQSGSVVVGKALAVIGSDVYLGGNFPAVLNAGGSQVPGTSCIARWNGSTWSSLGGIPFSSFNSPVSAMAVRGSDLYVGGDFSSVGSPAVNAAKVAKWNGTVWSALGSGVSAGSVAALAFDSAGNLYMGGVFTTAGGQPANCLAVWDGNAWSAVGSGANGEGSQVRALTEGGLGLYVGGFFNTVGASLVSPLVALVNFGPPAITTVVGPAAGGYKVGSVLTFTVTFGGPVTVTGSPQLGLTIGSTAPTGRLATLVPVPGGVATNVFTFTYTVQAGDVDADGIGVASSLTGGTFTSASGASPLTFTPPATTAVLVDTVPPNVVSVVRLNPGPQLLAAGTRQVVFRVTYSEAVQNVIPAGFSLQNVNGGTVTGTIGTPVGVGGTTVYDVPVTITGGAGEFRLRVNQ